MEQCTSRILSCARVLATLTTLATFPLAAGATVIGTPSFAGADVSGINGYLPSQSNLAYTNPTLVPTANGFNLTDFTLTYTAVAADVGHPLEVRAEAQQPTIGGGTVQNVAHMDGTLTYTPGISLIFLHLNVRSLGSQDVHGSAGVAPFPASGVPFDETDVGNPFTTDGNTFGPLEAVILFQFTPSQAGDFITLSLPTSASALSQPIPEPSVLALFAVGLLGVVCWSRRTSVR